MSERERRPGRSAAKAKPTNEASEGRLTVATTRHAEGSAAREGRGTRPIAAEAPGTLLMSRSAAQAYKMLKAADAGRWRSRGGAAVDRTGGAQRSLDWTQSSGVKATEATQDL